MCTVRMQITGLLCGHRKRLTPKNFCEAKYWSDESFNLNQHKFSGGFHWDDGERKSHLKNSINNMF